MFLRGYRAVLTITDEVGQMSDMYAELFTSEYMEEFKERVYTGMDISNRNIIIKPKRDLCWNELLKQ